MLASRKGLAYGILYFGDYHGIVSFLYFWKKLKCHRVVIQKRVH
jgi:hypothetical protein